MVTPTPGEKPLLSLVPAHICPLSAGPSGKDCELTNHSFWENFGTILSKVPLVKRARKTALSSLKFGLCP